MLQTPDALEIKGSRLKLTGLLVLCLLMETLASGEFWWFPSARTEYFMWSGLLFFGLCTAICVWRLVTASRPVVTITPVGIRDIRISADLVPWSGVREIKTKTIIGQRFIVITVDPAVERHLALTPLARWSRGPNRAHGFDGLCVSAKGLQIGHNALFKACLAHWQARGA